MSARRVAVVGGGIIGLTSAYRLARAGHDVTVFDPAPAKGATWAAAGMVAPSGEIAPGEEDNYRLQRQAVGAWRQLGDELEALVGENVALHEVGTLITGWDASDRRLVSQFVELATQFDAPMRPVSREDSPGAFEGLSGRITEGVIMQGDAWIDPDQAVALLRRALDALGAHVVVESVESVGADGAGVVVEANATTFHADAGLLATGSTPLPSGAWPSGRYVIRPVRGMTARVTGLDRSSEPMIRAFVRGRTFYMVSRPKGYCVLGATSDERSELVVEVGELQRLLRDALDVVPALETAAVVDIRYGLRPASADLRPFFEEIEPHGWAWLSGHYRHGVTLAPLASHDAVRFAASLA
jgi:glycine oxidase